MIHDQLRAANVPLAEGCFVNGGLRFQGGDAKKSSHGREKGFEAPWEFSALKTLVINHD